MQLYPRNLFLLYCDIQEDDYYSSVFCFCDTTQETSICVHYYCEYSGGFNFCAFINTQENLFLESSFFNIFILIQLYVYTSVSTKFKYYYSKSISQDIFLQHNLQVEKCIYLSSCVHSSIEIYFCDIIVYIFCDSKSYNSICFDYHSGASQRLF